MSVVATPDQIAERHRIGLDRFDEIWDGQYHVNAAPHPRHSCLLRHAERLLDELRTVYATAERSALLHLSADDVSAHLPWNLIDP
jgi:hypothetical protein